MNSFRLLRALVVSMPLMLPLVGCSAGEAEDANSASDDVVVGESLASRTDLFRPSEDTALGSVKASMKGIEHWKLYMSLRGFTVRGISATDKIKVVYVVKLDANNKQEIVTNATGFVKASDFELAGDPVASTRLLAETIMADVKAASLHKEGGIAPQGFIPDAVCSFMDKAAPWVLGASLGITATGMGVLMSEAPVAGAVTMVGGITAGSAVVLTGLAILTGLMLYEFTASFESIGKVGGRFGLDGCWPSR